MRKSVKRFSLVVVGLFLISSCLLIAGCGGGSTSSSSGSTTETKTSTNTATNAPQEEKVVSFLSWGGTVQETFEQQGFAKKFQDETGYKLVFTPKATSAEIVAQTITQKDNPQVDVIMCDLGPLLGAEQQGCFAQMDENAIPNLKDLSATAKHGDYVYVYTSAGVMLYNPDYFKKQNLQPPTSWADLFRPEFKGKIIMPGIGNTFGLFTLVELAKLGGGDEKNIEPGFEKLKELAPQVSDWSDTITKFEQGFQSGETVLAVDEWVDATKMKNKGLPIELVIPKEGTFASPAAAAIVKNAKHPKGAELFLNFLISQGFLKYQGDEFGKGSFNTKVVLDPVKGKAALTGDKMNGLRTFDWATVTPLRPAWTERFNKIIAK